MCAAAQDHREARGSAWRLLWVSKEDSKWCCGLKWELNCFHVTKLFLIPAPLLYREKKKNAKEQGEIKEDWNTKFSFCLSKEYNSCTPPHPISTPCDTPGELPCFREDMEDIPPQIAEAGIHPSLWKIWGMLEGSHILPWTVLQTENYLCTHIKIGFGVFFLVSSSWKLLVRRTTVAESTSLVGTSSTQVLEQEEQFSI